MILVSASFRDSEPGDIISSIDITYMLLVLHKCYGYCIPVIGSTYGLLILFL